MADNREPKHVDMERPISPRRAAFAREYMVDHNGTQAAIRAGYSQRTAKQIGHQLLTFPDVQAEITRLEREAAERADITVEWWVRLVRRNAESANEAVSNAALALAGKYLGTMDDRLRIDPDSDLTPQQRDRELRQLMLKASKLKVEAP